MQSRRVPCEIPSFASLFWDALPDHRALHWRSLTHNRCRTASTGPGSGQDCCLLFHLDVLRKHGSSAVLECQAPSGRRHWPRVQMGKYRKNTMANLGWHLVSCLWRTGLKPCKKVDRSSMMKSRLKRKRWDEKKRWSIKQKQKLPLLWSSELRVALGFEFVFGFGS